MEAARTAALKGHRVTLYEKSDALGGLLKTIENVSFKWPQKDFKNYLILQINKSHVKVHLNTEATPALLKKQTYDAVLVAVGAEPAALGPDRQLVRACGCAVALTDRREVAQAAPDADRLGRAHAGTSPPLAPRAPDPGGR